MSIGARDVDVAEVEGGGDKVGTPQSRNVGLTEAEVVKRRGGRGEEAGVDG